ncbi:MAG TPA: hypothetical protein VG711_06650 [Phycisphaerales bacterium]|nr:hypothetical protein [Phycisphaerales bacterium]
MTQAGGNQNVPVPMDPTYPLDAYSPDRRLIAPRRVRNGIKLHARTNPPQFQPVVQDWLSQCLHDIPPATAAEGLEYARSGQTVQLEMSAGRLRARVQGRAISAYELELTWQTWSHEFWERLLEAIAADAGATAKVLADELPNNLTDLLHAWNERLLPTITDMHPHCACPLDQPCKHVVAALYLMADRMNEHPPTIFQLRGMVPEELVDRLRNLRTRMHAPQQARSRGPGFTSSSADAPPLEHCVTDFWRSPALHELRNIQPLRHPPYALLHRLGPSPLGGKFPLVGLLASIYDTAAKHAGQLRERNSRVMDIDVRTDVSEATAQTLDMDDPS